MITLDQQIKCLKAELDRRKVVMPKLVAIGRCREEKATHEIECMKAAHQTLTQLRGIIGG